jgi:tetratricopeptide (TPR) repeat protein
MRKPAAFLILLLLLTLSFTLATVLQPHATAPGWRRSGDSQGLLSTVLGEGRRLFASYYFVKADVYFHSGYYPSIFDRSQAPKDARHMTAEPVAAEQHNDKQGDEHAGHQHGDAKDEHAGHDHDHEHEKDGEHAHGAHEHDADAHEKEMDFLKRPGDWIDRFGRNFMITEHTHLQKGKESEILPWLRLSADLDPQRVETYTVAAFWLRNRLNKVDAAQDFLRQGLRANPNSHEIFFELGRLYYENHHDPSRARNVWEMALTKWMTHEAQKPQPDLFELAQIALNLSRLEEAAGNFQRAIELIQLAMKASPNPDLLQKQINELEQKLTNSPAILPGSK